MKTQFNQLRIFITYLPLLLTILLSSQVSASVVYGLSGSCASGCVGFISGELILADSYMPGTRVTTSDFISFSYASSSGSFTIPADLALNRFTSGILPLSSGPSLEWVEIDAINSGSSFHGCASDGDPNNYFCPAAGFWSVEWYPLGIVRETGFSHSWTLVGNGSVPIPSAVWLFGSGLIGLFGITKRNTHL